MTNHSKHNCNTLNVSILSESRDPYSDMDDHELTDDHDQQGQEEEDGSNKDDLYASSGNIFLSVFQ